MISLKNSTLSSPTNRNASLKWLIFSFTFFLFSSCYKDSLEVVNEGGILEFRTNIPEVINGRLVFSSSENLSDYINELKDFDDSIYIKTILDLEDEGFPSAVVVSPTEQVTKFVRMYGSAQNAVDVNEDSLLVDNYFASILNKDYEVIVQDTLFKYTNKGLFFSDSSNYTALKAAIDSYQLGTDRGLSEISSGIFRYATDIVGGGVPTLTEGSPEMSDPPPPVHSDPTPTPECYKCSYNLSPDIATLEVCNYSGGGLIDDLFGTSVDCVNYFEHDGDKRINFKFAAVNYFIYATVSQKVKIQEKKTIAGINYWDKSPIRADILETGLETAEFEYDWSPPANAELAIPERIVVIYGSVKTTFNSSGQMIAFEGVTQRELFDDFPFSDNETYVQIYLPETIQELLGGGSYSISGEDFNEALAQLSEQAANMLLQFASIELSPGTPIVIPQADISNDNFIYTLRDYKEKKCTENKIERIFFTETAKVGFSSDFNGNTSFAFDPPTSVDVLEFIGYGVGKEDGCHITGSRIHLIEQE